MNDTNIISISKGGQPQQTSHLRNRTLAIEKSQSTMLVKEAPISSRQIDLGIGARASADQALD